MRSIFALFDTYDDAEAAVRGLLERDFTEDQMNLLIQEQVAKNNLDADLGAVNVRKTNGVGTQSVQGLDALVGGRSAINLADAGVVIAAGDTATTLVRSAAQSGLQAALEDFLIPETVAEAFASGVADGKILFWIRADDRRSGVAQDVLIMHKGRHTGSYNDSASPALR